jgi:sugar lactone lactonase YvrE
VREGGEVLETIDFDLGCFSCALGGNYGKTLFVVANEWRGMDKISEVVEAQTGQLLMVDAPAPAAAWP